MGKTITLVAFLSALFNIGLFAQGGVNVEGYVFEEGNRGYLNAAKIVIIDPETGEEKGLSSTDMNGVFISVLPAGKVYDVLVQKDLFTTKTQELSTVGKKDGEKVFIKIQMNRKPGYIFDVTVAEKRASDTITVDAITGATIEVYNNTKQQSTLELKNHPTQTFKAHFEDGNHYTVLIRKKDYYNKRMEAFVNVKGCILCFEGVGEIKPSDALSEGNTMGTLVANVELEPIKMNEGVLLENLYYEYGSAKLKPEAKFELDKLINILVNNPALIVELGSHTDSRGEDDFNFDLSSRRAKSAVDYIIANSDIDRNRVRNFGYGETNLVNKCSNGSNCSEEEHAKNRRTELKVVGMLDIDPFKNKSLVDIMDAERFERMLIELQNEEQVVIQAGEELPDELKKSLEGEKEEAEKGKDKIVDTKIAEPEITLEKPKIPATPKEVVTEIVNTEKEIPAKVVETEIVEVAKEVVEVPVVTKPIEKPRIETPEVIAEKEIITEVEVNIPEEKEVVVEQVKSRIQEEAKIPSGSTTGTSSTRSGKIFTETAISTPREARRATNLPEGYSGYRIEFVSSPYELPGSHEIFQRHGRITMDQEKNGSFSYMLGDFQEEKDAVDFLKNILKPQYPAARVINYKKGNRTNG